jgi:hypothetical protein
MPALFVYIIAVVVLLGGGYAGLQWLAEPEPVRVATHAGKESPKDFSKELSKEFPRELSRELSKSRQAAERTRSFADVEGANPYARELIGGDVQSRPTVEAAAEPQASADPGKTTQPLTEPNPAKDPAKDVAGVPRGGCMPFGITGKGELVFPMECQAILTQYGAGRKAPQPNPDESTPASPTETPAEPAEHSEVTEPAPQHVPPP